MPKKAWKIPVRKNGSVMEYAGEGIYVPHDTLPADSTFDLNVRVEGFSRGRSAVTVYLVDELSGGRYPMKVSEFLKMVEATTLKKGRVNGRFGVVKQGANYSMSYLGSIPEEGGDGC